MATVNKYNAKTLRTTSGVPYGNTYSEQFTFSVNASGIMTDSDLATAVQSGDVVRIGWLPAGTRIDDAFMVVSDAFASSTTAKVGFQYVDGTDVTAVPQDDDFFFSGTAQDSTGLTRKTTITRPVVLPKDAYVIYTVGGAAHSAAGTVDIVISGIVVGAK